MLSYDIAWVVAILRRIVLEVGAFFVIWMGFKLLLKEAELRTERTIPRRRATHANNDNSDINLLDFLFLSTTSHGLAFTFFGLGIIIVSLLTSPKYTGGYVINPSQSQNVTLPKPASK